MPGIFLSYKREDAVAAERLAERLRAAGFDLWWDRDIAPDAPWESTIERALTAATVVLVCWSRAAVASENVRSEARWAREQGRLIQLFVEPCDPPLFFGERQGVDLIGWTGNAADARFVRLVAELRGRLGATVTRPGGGADRAGIRERRQVTVLSAELADAARLSRDVDPEELDDLLARFAALVEASVAAAGGRVSRSGGDGLLAYFGWPQAREDAAETAVRAGLHLIAGTDRLRGPDGRPLHSRAGIATGLVVVGGDSNGAGREESMAGEAPNLAAGLRRLAAPGALVISEMTHRQVGRLFACETVSIPPHGDGATAPGSVWRVTGEEAHASRFEAMRAVRTAFVGRTHEFALLADRWRTAVDGNGRTAVILGEAGMGKSRLAAALVDQIRAEPHHVVTWQCSPYHSTKAFYPVVEYLATAAGIADADTPVEQLRKLIASLDAARTPVEHLALFARLLAIPLEGGPAPPDLPPGQIRAATIAALTGWARRLASARPLLLLLEDAHWIDATTLELMSRLVADAADVPLLIVITARPEFASPWSGRAEVGTIGLDRLNSRDCETLAREVAGTTAERRTVAEIVARSDGNPLFIEELGVAVSDAGAAASGVPDSLQSSLMARLDRLGDAKRTAQICSVLGRRFARPLLTHVAPMAPDRLDVNLALLVENDVIRPLGFGESRYEFKHALVRDAAYESLLRAERRNLHNACGRALERYFSDVARTEPELLAQHFARAGAPELASDYAERAGDRATSAGAFQEAVASYEEALRQNDDGAESEGRNRRAVTLLLKLGPPVSLIDGAQAPAVDEIYRRAETLSRASGDDGALFKAVWGRWYHANVSLDIDAAAGFAQQLVAIGRRSGDEDLAFEALHCRWSSAWFRADYRLCADDARRGVELYDRARHHQLGLVFAGHDPGVCAHGCEGQSLVVAGEVNEGLAAVDRAIALADALDHPGSLAHGLMIGMVVATIIRSTDLLRQRLERMTELSGKFDLPPQKVAAAYHFAWLEAETGDRAKGLVGMSKLYDRVTAIGSMILQYKIMYVDQLLRVGRAREALEVSTSAIAALRAPDRGLLVSEIVRLRGEALAAVGRREEAVAVLTHAETLAARDGAALLRLRAATSLVRDAGGSRERLIDAVAAMPGGWDGPDLAAARGLLSH